jgi:hypothetical protein
MSIRKLTDVDCHYGVPMGRTFANDDPGSRPVFELHRVHLDKDGYDEGGAYWGLGETLYWAVTETGETERFFRAGNEEAAQAVVLNEWPHATFAAPADDEPDAFVWAYIEAMLWASTDGDGNPLDDEFSAADVAPEALASIIADCRAFRAAAGSLLDRYGTTEQGGHDFFLTRCHHGTGFWDRGYGEAGERLTDFAHSFGEVYPYAGDADEDGCRQVYV